MSMDCTDWLVYLAGHSRHPVDSTRTRQLLEQSDLGGDIVLFADGPRTISLVVATAAPSEQRACHRVVARVKDALGSHWSVVADPGASHVDATPTVRWR